MSDKKVLTSAIGTLSALSFSLGAIAAEPSADKLFEAESLERGFMAQSVGFEEGSCGEGSCGEGACGEGSCGEDKDEDEDKDKDKDEDDKDEEGSCGEGACGEGTCGEA
ncbi:MAG: low-complexity protein [Wenzhouxiangella sp.]